MKKRIFNSIIVLIVYLFCETMSWFALKILEAQKHISFSPVSAKHWLTPQNQKAIKRVLNGEKSYLQFDSDLGWTLTPNYREPYATSNPEGLRGSKDYSAKKPYGKIRINTFGDSFTYCQGVKDKDTWQEQMEQEFPNLEVLNFGVPGYGLSQAFLRYLKEKDKYESDVVIIAYMTENIFRHVNTFRPFYTYHDQIPFSKPRFLITNNQLQFFPNPIRSLEEYHKLLETPDQYYDILTKNDFFFNSKYKSNWFDIFPSVRLYKIIKYEYIQNKYGIIKHGYYNTQSEAFQITTKIFDQFVVEVAKQKAFPLIVIFPYDQDIIQFRTHHTKTHQPLIDYLNERHYPYVDFTDVLDEYAHDVPLEKLINIHYSPLTNKLISMTIYKHLFEKYFIQGKQ